MNFFAQALCWKYYSKLRTKQAYTSSKTQILSPKIKKKTTKNVRIWMFFQILTYINFRQTNAINMIFLLKLYAGNTTANQRIL